MAEANTNEDLVKRARYGGRNVTGLAILATLLTTMFLIAQFVQPEKSLFLWCLSFVIITVSYWLLAIAARRGDPLSLSIILGFLTVQFILTLAGQLSAFFRTKSVSLAGMIGIAIPLLVFLALSRNRADLIDLRRRGLWESVFGAMRSTKTFCIVGGILMLIGLISFYAALLIPALEAARNGRVRQDFVNLIMVDEKDFLGTMAKMSGTQDPEALNKLLAKAKALEEKAREIAQRAPESSGMKSIASNYVEAVGKWNSALNTLREEGSANDKASSQMAAGDEFRQKAMQEFDKRFPPAENVQR